MALPTTWTNPDTLEKATSAILPSADLNKILGNQKILGGTTGAGTMRKIAELSGAAGAYDFTSIPQTFRGFVIHGVVRGDNASLTSLLRAQVNNDTGPVYYWQEIYGQSTTVAGTEGIGTAYMEIGACPANSATSAHFAPFEILLPDYTNATNKKAILGRIFCTYGTGTGNQIKYDSGGIYVGANPITSIKLFVSAGSFAANSRATLYGLPV
jgi:hypothetical protein